MSYQDKNITVSLVSHLLIALSGTMLLALFHGQLGRAFEQLERQSGLDITVGGVAGQFVQEAVGLTHIARHFRQSDLGVV